MLGNFLRILFTVLLVMDPIGIIPQFLSVTAPYDEATRKGIVLKAVLISGLVLGVFLLSGKLLLDFFGIHAGAFSISGGVLFFMIAYGMIYSRPRKVHSVPTDKLTVRAAGAADGEDGEDHTGVSVALFPLAIPFISGPGLLTVIIMFTSQGESWPLSVLTLLPAIVIGLITTFIVLRSSALLLRFFGSMGIFILEKLMGLILSGFAVQFIYNGLLTLGIIHP